MHCRMASTPSLTLAGGRCPAGNDNDLPLRERSCGNRRLSSLMNLRPFLMLQPPWSWRIVSLNGEKRGYLSWSRTI